MTVKIGLFGGSFDPVHLAHLTIAGQALRQFSLDRVIWIPASVSPFKQSVPLMASSADRLEMVRRVCADNPKFEVSDFEIEKGGVSYSIDTLRHFQSRFKSAQFFWILGADALAGVPRWRDAEAVIKELVFLVAGRDGEMDPILSSIRFEKITFTPCAVSSTEIKAGLALGRNWNQLHPRVAEYIRTQRLFGVAA